MEPEVIERATNKLVQNSIASQKDKRYVALVEKAIATFYSMEEWADYITFLSRLLKTLALPEKARTVSWIPLLDQILNKLALCLSPALPSGVHQKTLTVYSSIFDGLTIRELNKQISVWLPGLLLVLSYGSTQVKPQLLSLYEKLIESLDSKTLKSITRPLLRSISSGLDDENSENFSDCLKLLELFKEKLALNALFWQEMFLCIISSPEKRIGAFNWCLIHLPVFSTFQRDTNKVYSSEAQACLEDKGGLLIRAFASALDTHTSFNPATDIVVIRGFFDLLLARLPLNSPVLTELAVESDKQLLIMACVKTTLKKEMSLNRRLWAWFLGPTSTSETLDSNLRENYFSKHALSSVKRGILSLLEDENTKGKISAIRMSLSLVIEKWEISRHVTPLVFASILSTCKRAVSEESESWKEIMTDTKLFFNQVEAHYIWHYIICDLISNEEENNDTMLVFILKNFDLPDDQTSQHILLAILAYLLRSPSDVCISTLETLVNLSRLEITVAENLEPTIMLDRTKVLEMIYQYYNELSEDENAVLSIENLTITCMILSELKSLFVIYLQDREKISSLADILSTFVYSMSRLEGQVSEEDVRLKDAILEYPARMNPDSLLLDDATIFAIFKLCRYLVPAMCASEKSRLLKIILSNFWNILSSMYPAKNQVEAVKSIFDLSASFDESEIEAGLVTMLLSWPTSYRYKTFKVLWVHSSDINDSYSILVNPLFIILDGLETHTNDEAAEARRFLSTALKENTMSRLFQMVTEPLVHFLSRKTDEQLNTHEDIALVEYHLHVLRNVICSNKRAMKDVMNKEFVAAESLAKFQIITNSWKVSNYRSLVLKILMNISKLKPSPIAYEDETTFSSFYECTSVALELYSMCLSGPDHNFDTLFCNLVDVCYYYIDHTTKSEASLEPIICLYFRCIHDLMHLAKTLNISLRYCQKDSEETEIRMNDFMVDSLSLCNSPSLLDVWFRLSHSTLHVLKSGIFDFLMTLVSVINSKIKGYYKLLKTFERPVSGNYLEESLLILLAGLETMMAIIHSHLIRSAVSASSSSTQGENGFLGNVLSGVFQLEAPYAKSEEEKITNSVLSAISSSSLMTFELWNWADTQPSKELPRVASQQSVKHITNRVRFRSKKVLECLSELERQRVIETIVASTKPVPSKIKILHVLDSGRPQVSVPPMVTSIKGLCYPQGLSEKEKVQVWNGIKAIQMSSFLPFYFESIDYDIVEDLWDQISKFIKEVLAHVSYYLVIMFDLLDVMRKIAYKMKTRKFNHKELASLYSTCLNIILSRKQEIIEAGSESGFSESLFYQEMNSHVEDWSVTLQEQDKISTALTTVINTMVLPKIKAKGWPLDSCVAVLLKSIGDNYPLKPWKLVMHDIFMDSSYFTNKYADETWQKCALIWISNDSEKLHEIIARVVPSQQLASTNIFQWNDSSNIQNCVLYLKRISYLFLVQPTDAFGPQLKDLFSRLASAWKVTASSSVKSEILTIFRAASLRFSESHLLPHWSFIIQSLADSLLTYSGLTTKELSNLSEEPLSLLLSSCKLLDQLLLLRFDEFNTNSWLFVGSGSIDDTDGTGSYVDRLAKKSESLMSKETPILVSHPQKGEMAKPLLMGIREIKSTAMLKVFLGLFSYVNYERTYGLCDASIVACEEDVLGDLVVIKK